MDEAALAAAIGGSAIGLAGIGLTWRNSAKEREHQRLLVAEERVWDACTTTYLDLLVALGRMLRDMEGANPIAADTLEREALTSRRISDEITDAQRIEELQVARRERLELKARLAAFGSVAVREATDEFFAAEDHFSDLWTQQDAYDELDQAVMDARKAFAKVESLVRSELGAYSTGRVSKTV